jgi:hypothetical protein
LLLRADEARAVDLQIQFDALERLLGQQVFTEDGRKYVRGDRRTRCDFAYLEHPKISGADGRLTIRAQFTGQSALNVLGQCVGLGDAFGAVIVARPEYRNGNLGLAQVTVVSEDRTGFYIRRVCAALAHSLAHDFHYPLAAEARKTLEETPAGSEFRRELRDFRVTDVRVTDDALVLALDFALTVK